VNHTVVDESATEIEIGGSLRELGLTDGQIVVIRELRTVRRSEERSALRINPSIVRSLRDLAALIKLHRNLLFRVGRGYYGGRQLRSRPLLDLSFRVHPINIMASSSVQA
jgi:hypothetical protein